MVLTFYDKYIASYAKYTAESDKNLRGALKMHEIESCLKSWQKCYIWELERSV